MKQHGTCLEMSPRTQQWSLTVHNNVRGINTNMPLRRGVLVLTLHRADYDACLEFVIVAGGVIVTDIRQAMMT